MKVRNFLVGQLSRFSLFLHPSTHHTHKNLAVAATMTSKGPVALFTLPLEVTTNRIRHLYCNEVILLFGIGSLARLSDVAATNNSLALFQLRFLCDHLAGRLIL